MENSPDFFVPYAKPDKQEQVYAELASLCNTKIPDVGKRIYSITFVHDGEEWIATVGEKLYGYKLKRKKTRYSGSTSERFGSLNDSAIVLAIFPGNPFYVVTDSGSKEDRPSMWVNPFMAGKPEIVKYFEKL